MKRPGGLTLAAVALATAATLIVTGFREEPAVEPDAPPDRTERERPPARTHTKRSPRPSPVEPGRIRGPRTVQPPPITAEAMQETPIALMPANTVVAGIAPNYQRLTDQLGLLGLLDRHRDMLVDLEAGLAKVGLVPSDLVDPTSVGLDVVSPTMLAVVGVDKPVIVMGARIGDEVVLSQVVDTLAAVGELVEVDMEQSQLLVESGDKPRLGILRRAGLVYLLVAEGWDTDVMTVAAQITWQAPEDSLSTTPAWAQAFENVRGDEGWLFVNGPAIYAELRAGITERLARDAKELEELPEDDTMAEWTRERYRRAEAGLALFEAFFGGLGGIGAGVDLDGGAARVEAHVGLEPGSLLQRLLRNRPRTSALQHAVEEAPLFALDGMMDPQAMRELVTLFAGLAGADLDRAMLLVKAFGGIDRDPLTLLTGELGIAVSATGLDTGSPTWSVTVTAGVTDPRDARKLIDHLGGLATMADMVEYDEETGGVVIEVPWWRPLRLAVAGDAVILSTELSAIDRLKRRAAPTSAPTGHRDLDHLLTSAGHAGTWMMDFELFLPALMRGHHVAMAKPSPEAENHGDLARITAEIQRVEEERETLQRETWTGIIHLLGSVALSGRAEATGLRLQGGWFWESHTPADLLAAVVDAAVEEERQSRRLNARTDALYAERAALIQAGVTPQPPLQ